MMRVLLPLRMLSQAPSWAAVGALKVVRNQSRTGVEKWESASVMYLLWRGLWCEPLELVGVGEEDVLDRDFTEHVMFYM